MTAAGPPVEVLTRRLLETPGEFLAPTTVVPALVADLLALHGAVSLDQAAGALLRPLESPEARNWLGCVAVSSWLLADPTLVAPGSGERAWVFLTGDDLRELASLVPAPALVSEPDRREELARRALAALELVPAGETEAEAADRLTTLDSSERARVVAATREAEVRAEAVREAMHAKAAAEAAAKASRE